MTDDCRQQCPLQPNDWCPRHQMYKPGHWITLCTTKDKYFQAWERGEGPGQRFDTPAGPAREAPGVGSCIARSLGRCKQFQQKQLLNEWGPAKCLEEEAQVIAWIQEYSTHFQEAPISAEAAARLLRLAIERVERTTQLAKTL